MTLRQLTCAALALAACSSAAHAATFLAGGLAKPTMTYTTVDQVRSSVTSGYSGVGSLFVSSASTAVTGYGSLCSGSLISPTVVLTAAHCVYGHDEATGAVDPVTSIDFYLPSFGDAINGTAEAYTANAFAFNPSYDTADGFGDITSGNDVALFTLSTPVTGHDFYDLYLGDPLQQYLEVGTGTVGGPGGTGVGAGQDFLKRTGTNLFEYYGDDVFSDVSHGVVLSDFDDGTDAHDVFGKLGLSQTGIPGEANSSPGDSGGPEFIDGKIASVTSFGITGGILDGYCGGNSTDPYNAAGTTAVQTDLSQCTNSSVGEIAGDTLVSYNLGFITSYLNGTAAYSALPEPATWAELMLGFGLIGGLARSRRTRAATA